MTYTQEQINAMTADQLKAAILELQAAGAVIVNDETEPIAAPKTPVQTDIEKIEAHIAALKTDSEELYAAGIAALEAKRDALIAEAKVAVEEGENEIKAEAQKAKTEVTTFWGKYGQAIAHGAEIILLAYIAGRLAGVL